MSKILKLIKTLSNTKIVWKKPLRKKILIYDNTNSDKLIKFLEPESFQVLHTRKELLNAFILIKCFFSIFKDFSFYIDKYIDTVKPELIITFIDNDLKFFSLKSRHRNIEILMIQNGTRSYHGDIFEQLDKLNSRILEKYQLDTFLTFGDDIGNYYAKFIQINKLINFGSLSNNSVKLDSLKTVKDRVVYISQWHYLIEKSLDPHCEKKITKFINSYCIKKNKKLNILLRSNDDKHRSDEINFFKNIIGKEVIFIEKSISMNSYNICDSSELVVGIDSTLCYESLARKQKTAIFSIRGNAIGIEGYKFGWPRNFSDVGPFWCNFYDEKIFTNILDDLIQMPKADWHNLLFDNDIKKCITYNKNNSILINYIESFK